MTLPPHLHPINFGQAATNNGRLHFTGFQDLPKELRLEIWRYALQRQRFIHIRIFADKAASAEIQNIACAAERNLDILVMNGTRWQSKLHRVNKESRAEALKFYRIHLPCKYQMVHEGRNRDFCSPYKLNDGVVHINPEWDVLWISRTYGATKALIPFLHQLKAVYDPRRVGLLNLAFEGSDLILCDFERSEYDHVMWSSFVETLLQLREIWIVSITKVGRQVNNALDAYNFGTPAPVFNRSVPIMSTPVTFERLPRDPRPIGADLEYVIEVGGQRRWMEEWLQLLRQWTPLPPASATPIPPTQKRAAGPTYRILHAFNPSGTPREDFINSRSHATTWLQQTEDQWDGIVGINNDVETSTWPVGRKTWRVDWHEDLDQAVRPAFGCWLFPLEAIGRLADGDGDGDRRFLVPEEDQTGRRDQVMDMRAHWPELLVSCLP